MKAHEANEENSESDDDEFSGRALVYDSDEEEEVFNMLKAFPLFYVNEIGEHLKHLIDETSFILLLL